MRDAAIARDRSDPLAGFRERFVVEGDLVYLDGNSLGRPPKAALGAVEDTMREWATHLVQGWDRWLDLGVEVGDQLAPLIGADSGEVAVCDQTSVNLYKCASAALHSSRRSTIVTDRGNFPSDLYVLDSVATAAGGRLLLVDEDPSIDELYGALDQSVGVVALTHVAYRSGTMFDGAAVTRLAHDAGALMLWDLAHSAGAVPVDLRGWGADLAVGCTYKYLNGGPGAPGFLYVSKGIQTELEQPIRGWFGHENQFSFRTDFVPAGSIRRFLTGTPPIISLAAAAAGIEVTADAGIPMIREKGTALTSAFIDVVDTFADAYALSVASPRSPDRRGSHVALRHDSGYSISLALRDRGVVVDFREPDIIRFGFAPLYNRHVEVVEAADRLLDILDTEAWSGYPSSPTGVT